MLDVVGVAVAVADMVDVGRLGTNVEVLGLVDSMVEMYRLVNGLRGMGEVVDGAWVAKVVDSMC